jgi:hypothetical protein
MATKSLLAFGQISSMITVAGVALILSTGSGMLISGCGTPSTTDSLKTENGMAQSREDVLKIINGGWVNVEYVDALHRVHSPMFAAEAGRPVQEISFDVTKMKGDTVYNTSGRLNFIEGDRFDLVISNGNNGLLLTINDGIEGNAEIKAGYKIADGDTLLSLINTANNDTTWFVNQYKVVPRKADLPVSPLEYCVNNELLSGEWKSSSGQTVTFHPNGTVTGWDAWTMYSLEVDKFGVEIQPDVISAYNDKKGATYVYALDNGKLSVYEYMSEGEEAWTRGKLVQEFTRK